MQLGADELVEQEVADGPFRLAAEEQEVGLELELLHGCDTTRFSIPRCLRCRSVRLWFGWVPRTSLLHCPLMQQ